VINIKYTSGRSGCKARLEGEVFADSLKKMEGTKDLSLCALVLSRGKVF